MPIVQSLYRPSKLIHNGHLQTMYPYFFRKVKDVDYKRFRLELSDGDFLDVDLSDAHSDDELIILTHGLEGSSTAGYIKGMTKYFTQQHKKDVLAWNMRSCSGEINRKEIFYHAAMTEDLDEVIHFALQYKNYKKITLIGFSLGANLNAFYLGKLKEKVPEQVRCAIMFSTPLCLSSCISKLHSTSIGQVYANSFLKTMKYKVTQKHKRDMLKDIDIRAVKKAKTFKQFDNLVTAPLSGFKNAEAYYAYASAINLLEGIRVPTLLVQAKDDPFLVRESFPFRLARNHKYLHLEVTPSGGHVGFLNYDQGLEFWSEQRAAEFIAEQTRD